MQIRAFARFAHHYAVPLSEFVRKLAPSRGHNWALETSGVLRLQFGTIRPLQPLIALSSVKAGNRLQDAV